MLQRARVRTCAAALAVAGLVVGGSASYSASATTSAVPGVTVTAGDTLWGIALTNGVTVGQLAAANGMALTDVLLIGRHLVIPGQGSSSRSTAQGSSSGSSTSGSASGSSGSATGGSASGGSGSGGGGPVSGADFCATTTFDQGPYGQIPSQLAALPDRLSLRPVMAGWAEHYGVAPALVEAIAWQESGWQEGVVSPDHAVGIGQLLPATAQFVNDDLLGTNLNLNVANDNIHMEAAFLAYLIRQVGDKPVPGGRRVLPGAGPPRSPTGCTRRASSTCGTSSRSNPNSADPTRTRWVFAFLGKGLGKDWRDRGAGASNIPPPVATGGRHPEIP